MRYYMGVLEKYTVFSGRASRTEYWIFSLFNFLFALTAIMLDNLLDTTFHFSTTRGYENLPYGAIYLVYLLALFVPTLAVTVRRLHDTGRSGVYILIGFIPVLGSIWLFVLLVTKGDYREKNRYGNNPAYLQPYTTLSYDSAS